MKKSNISPNFTILSEEQFESFRSILQGLHHQKSIELRMKDYITKDAACEHFGWGEATWYRLRNEGLIKVYRLGKKQYIRLSELERTLENSPV